VLQRDVEINEALKQARMFQWIAKTRQWYSDRVDERLWWRGFVLLPLLLIRLFFTDTQAAIYLTALLALAGIFAYLIRRKSP
jgi:hypothetical protein